MADYIDGMVLPTSARLKRKRYSEADLTKLRSLAAEGAFDPDSVEDAVFFPVNASANTIDSYGTFMLPSTLHNFAEDATKGVAVLDSHNSRRLNFGMSVTGEYGEETVSGEKLRFMQSDFYTIPGIQTEGLNTDAYIKGVNAGIFRDVSVGFWMPPGSEVRCTICGKDMLRWYMEEGCRHFPSVEYEVEADGTTRSEIAYGAVDGGRLSEYSLVPDGATPGAGVAKAQNMEDAGELEPEVALHLERAYHTSFPRATRRYQGVTLIGGHSMSTKTKRAGEDDTEAKPTPNDMTDVQEEVINEDVSIEPTVINPVEQEPEVAEPEPEPEEDETGERAIEKSGLRFTKGLREALNDRYSTEGIVIGERVSDAVVALADEVKRLRGEVSNLNDSKRELEVDAKAGRAYRSDLIEELKREVIRSANDEEDKEAKSARYERLAESVDIETIKGLRDDFASAARAKFGSGRRTVDNEESGSGKPSIPTSAYDE